MSTTARRLRVLLSIGPQTLEVAAAVLGVTVTDVVAAVGECDDLVIDVDGIHRRVLGEDL